MDSNTEVLASSGLSEIFRVLAEAKTEDKFSNGLDALYIVFITSLINRDSDFFQIIKKDTFKIIDHLEINDWDNKNYLLGKLESIFLLSNTLSMQMPNENKLVFVKNPKSIQRSQIVDILHRNDVLPLKELWNRLKDEFDYSSNESSLHNILQQLVKKDIIKNEKGVYILTLDGHIIANYISSSSISLNKIKSILGKIKEEPDFNLESASKEFCISANILQEIKDSIQNIWLDRITKEGFNKINPELESINIRIKSIEENIKTRPTTISFSNMFPSTSQSSNFSCPQLSKAIMAISEENSLTRPIMNMPENIKSRPRSSIYLNLAKPQCNLPEAEYETIQDTSSRRNFGDYYSPSVLRLETEEGEMSNIIGIGHPIHKNDEFFSIIYKEKVDLSMITRLR